MSGHHLLKYLSHGIMVRIKLLRIRHRTVLDLEVPLVPFSFSAAHVVEQIHELVVLRVWECLLSGIMARVDHP